MKKVLYILGELDDDDAEWLAQMGAHRKVPAGTVLIHQGREIDAVFFVTEGTFSVTTAGAAEAVAEVGAGEVLGEISYVDRHPPTATVTAVEDSAVLAVSRSALTEKIEIDPGFAGRFYRAVAVFLAERLRSTLRQLGGEAEEDETAELDLLSLDSVSRAGVRFERILQKLQRA